MRSKAKCTYWPFAAATISLVFMTLACGIIADHSPTTKPQPEPTHTPTPMRTPTLTWTSIPTPATGETRGQVIDSLDGAPVPLANVHTNPPTESVTADRHGRYVILDVAPGVYMITAAKPGYASASVSVAVNAGRATTADIHLAAVPTGVPAPTPKPFLTDGLVAYYPFDGNADDASGNGNHGIVHGATLTMDRFDNADSAYSFDGVDDYIVSSSDISLNTTYSILL